MTSLAGVEQNVLCMAPCVQRIVLWPGGGSGRYCFLGFDKIGMQRTPRHATPRGGRNFRCRYCDDDTICNILRFLQLECLSAITYGSFNDFC